MKQDWTLITVNTIGAALQTLYILVYLCFSPEKVGGEQVPPACQAPGGGGRCPGGTGGLGGIPVKGRSWHEEGGAWGGVRQWHFLGGGFLCHRGIGPDCPLPVPQRRVLLQSAALLGVLTLGFCYFNLLTPDVDVRLAHLGLFCSVFTISMYLSPLAALVRVAPSWEACGGEPA